MAKNGECSLCFPLLISCLFKAIFFSLDFLCIDGCSPISFHPCDLHIDSMRDVVRECGARS